VIPIAASCITRCSGRRHGVLRSSRRRSPRRRGPSTSSCPPGLVAACRIGTSPCDRARPAVAARTGLQSIETPKATGTE
jgi:hypothetical protein